MDRGKRRDLLRSLALFELCARGPDGSKLEKEICMPKSKSVELRSSDVKEKRSKPVVVLRGCLKVVRLLVSLFNAADKLWDVVSNLF